MSKITYEIPQELNISNKNSLMLVVLLSKYTHIFFTVMMFINNKLNPVPKTNPLRNDSGGNNSSLSVIGSGIMI